MTLLIRVDVPRDGQSIRKDYDFETDRRELLWHEGCLMRQLDTIKDCHTCAHCIGIKTDRYTGDVDIGCALDECECECVLINGVRTPSGWIECTYDGSEEGCW